jgi:DUF1009 family protein
MMRSRERAMQKEGVEEIMILGKIGKRNAIPDMMMNHRFTIL